MAKQSKRKKNGEARVRLTVTLESETKSKGEFLADMDKRDLSHELDWLIEQEHKRRIPAMEAA